MKRSEKKEYWEGGRVAEARRLGEVRKAGEGGWRGPERE